MIAISAKPNTTRKRSVPSSRPPREGAAWLLPAETAHFLDVSVQTLALWRVQGRGPKFARPMPRVVRYRRADLEAWLANSVVSSTTEADNLDTLAA